MFGGSHKPTSFSYINYNENNGESVMGVGGVVEQFMADINLNIGDFVYLDSTGLGTVTKSITAGNYASVRVGVVVGGVDIGTPTAAGECLVVQDDNAIGTLASYSGHPVLVMRSGVCKMLADAAITALQLLGPGTSTAGYAKADTTAGRGIGLALEAQATPGGILRVRINQF